MTACPIRVNFKSKLYHIYADETVKDDINRAAKEEEPLPDLITQAYYLLGKDWQALYEAWNDAGCPVPPVMITVANRTETAARIKYAFDHQRIPVPELCNPDLTLRIDSKTLDEAESATGSKAEAAAALREMVDTVGQKGKTGEQIRQCDFGWYAVRGLGCEDRYAYSGLAGLFQSVALRTGYWSWPAPYQL